MRALFLIAALLLTGACAQQQTGSEPGVLPFSEFLSTVKTAKYSDYATSKVVNEHEFENMRGYLISRYEKAEVPKSFASNGIVFDCVTGAATQEAGSCPAGTAPMRRNTLQDLTGFATLQDFLAKAPDGGGLPPTTP